MFKILMLIACLTLVVSANEVIDVVKQAADVRADGFDSELELNNGNYQKLSGDEHGNEHGSFGWVSKEGEKIDITFVADENGYQPQGSVLPVGPPIPAEILKALEYIKSHPSKEVVH